VRGRAVNLALEGGVKTRPGKYRVKVRFGLAGSTKTVTLKLRVTR